MPSVDEFSAFCAELTLDNGRPMLLEDFQREILADYFAGARETLILLPKKNGKTALLAALGALPPTDRRVRGRSGVEGPGDELNGYCVRPSPSYVWV